VILKTVGADSISAKDTGAEMDSAPTPAIPKIVQSFKRHTTIEYIKMVKLNIMSKASFACDQTHCIYKYQVDHLQNL